MRFSFWRFCYFYTLWNGRLRQYFKRKQQKMIYISDHLCRILITNVSGSGKINSLINLINEQDYIDKTYLYAEDLSEYDTLI